MDFSSNPGYYYYMYIKRGLILDDTGIERRKILPVYKSCVDEREISLHFDPFSCFTSSLVFFLFSSFRETLE